MDNNNSLSRSYLIWNSSGILESVDNNTSLGDIRISNPGVYLIEKQNNLNNNIKISHRKNSYILQPGITYEVHGENKHYKKLNKKYEALELRIELLEKQNKIKELHKSRRLKTQRSRSKTPKKRTISKTLSLKDTKTDLIQQEDNSNIKKKPLKSKRQRIIDEIIHSEQVYKNNLDILINIFLPAFNNINDDNIISTVNIKLIFCDIQTILSTSINLLDQLALEIKNNPKCPLIGQVFVDNIISFKSYTNFVTGYPERIKLLKVLKENSKFHSILSNIEYENEQLLEKHTLSDILIHPIKRVPQYLILLNRLIQNTPYGHDDYSNLIKAEKACRELAEHFEEQSQNVISARKVIQIMNTIKIPKRFRSITTSCPHRVFIFEDNLRVNLKGKTSFYVTHAFNDCILFSVKGIVRSFWGDCDSTLKDYIYFSQVYNVEELQDIIELTIKTENQTRLIKIYPTPDEYNKWSQYISERNTIYKSEDLTIKRMHSLQGSKEIQSDVSLLSSKKFELDTQYSDTTQELTKSKNHNILRKSSSQNHLLI